MVDAARSGEREASVAGARSVETSPFGGQVLTYLVDVGQTVMPGMPLANYGSEDLRLKLRVVADDLDAVHVGTRVVTEVGDGRVIKIGGQAQGPGRLYQVWVALDDSTGLRVGEMLTVTLVVDEVASATAVPDGAIGEDEGGSYVLVEQGSALRRVDVTVGPRDRGWAAIEPSLSAGSRVVTSTLTGLDLSRPILAVTP